MKHFYASLLLLFTSVAFAQPYGNEWIKFSGGNQYSDQQYFKIKVWKDGIYRVRASELYAPVVGFPQGQDPHRFQIFHNGVEQYIYVNGEADGTFDQGDYIEFYGTKNDGKPDAQIYEDPGYQTYDGFSLINDTGAYFLTINSVSTNNKRMVVETDANFSNYNQATYFNRTIKYYSHDEYFEYAIDQFGLALSSYTFGEGYVTGAFKDVASTINLLTPNPSNVILPTGEIGFNGMNYRNHDYTISINSQQYSSGLFFGYENKNFPFQLNAPIGNSVAVTINALPDLTNGFPNYMSFGFINLNYAHTTSLSGENPQMYWMKVPAATTSKTHLNLTNVALASPIIYMSDGDSLKRIDFAKAGSSIDFVIPSYNNDKDLLIVDSSTSVFSNQTMVDYIVSPIKSKADPNKNGYFRNFADASNNPNAEYYIITHAKLWNEAVNYKDYRQSTSPHHYNCLIADIDELYDQFAFGISKHPASIRNFMFFALDNFQTKPKYLFMIGKSVSLDESRFAYADINLVPTFGNPPSDLMLTARRVFPDSLLKPQVATGRLAAQSPQQVTDYLNKVSQYENAVPDQWMKTVLHFSGGITGAQVNAFKQDMLEYQAIIEDTLFGADVFTLSKTVNDPIQIYLSTHLQEIIDSGVSIMTFRAHAASSTFDISTDDPQNWHNVGRYPLVIANSCYVGNIHSHQVYASENFVMQKDKGAVGFLAQASNGYPDPLKAYTLSLYKELSYYKYGQSIGEDMINLFDSTRFLYPSYFYGQSVCMDMNLHGDPALIINSPDQSDLVISQPDIIIDQQNISTQQDSFSVRIVIKNIGKGINKPFSVDVTRYFQNGSFTDTSIIYNSLAFVDTLRLTLPVDVAQGAGLNTIGVTLDALNTINNEISELNNHATNDFYIASSDIEPVYPVKYAIVPTDSVELRGSTSNPNAPSTVYVFQIDTIDTFDSNFKIQQKITAPGGLVQWPLPFKLTPNLVYYWRVSRDSMAGDPIHPKWNESSFIEIPTKTGWSQAHFFQFKNDTYKNIVYDRPDRKFEYVKTQSVIKVDNNTNGNTNAISFDLNGVLIDYSGCAIPSIHIAVIDQITLDTWTNKNGPAFDFGNFNNTNSICRADSNRKDHFFVFRTNVQQEMDSMKSMLQNKIPNGDYMLAYSFVNGGFSMMDVSVKTVFATMGSDSIMTLKDNQAWIFFTQIGNPLKGHEVFTDSGFTSTCQLTDSLGGNWYKGYVTSEMIGPAMQWTSFHWKMDDVEAMDSVSLNIVARSTSGQDTIMYANVTPADTLIDSLFTKIDATKYPYLYFDLYMQDDSIVPDPAYINKWQIYFEEVPEAMVAPGLYSYINKTKANEGDSIFVKMAIQNISGSPMDSMLVSFYLYNSKNQKIMLPSGKYKPLNPTDTLICSTALSTTNLGGLNTLWIEANPNNDQPEQFHFNNYAQIKFTVDRDITNPILDATFDGVHILNNDIVSAKPLIQMTFIDENKYLAMNDTNDYFVFLTDPNGKKTRLRFETTSSGGSGKSALRWYPAQMPHNKFRIEYNPDLTDGVYSLEVQGTDKTGNVSGSSNYKISFEVITASTITEVINYPNPFSTSTRFVFTLTGSEIPEVFRIQIMTVTGKIIREITREELGPIHIGRNISEYAWDGKDQYGDQLANGVYLYHVTTQLNSQGIEKRSTQADQYFKKGWGKMYLLK